MASGFTRMAGFVALAVGIGMGLKGLDGLLFRLDERYFSDRSPVSFPRAAACLLPMCSSVCRV